MLPPTCSPYVCIIGQSLIYYDKEKYHKLSRRVLHECRRHECNAALTTSHISCMCEIYIMYMHSGFVSVVTVPLDIEMHCAIWKIISIVGSDPDSVHFLWE